MDSETAQSEILHLLSTSRGDWRRAVSLQSFWVQRWHPLKHRQGTHCLQKLLLWEMARRAQSSPTLWKATRTSWHGAVINLAFISLGSLFWRLLSPTWVVAAVAQACLATRQLLHPPQESGPKQAALEQGGHPGSPCPAEWPSPQLEGRKGPATGSL